MSPRRVVALLCIASAALLMQCSAFAAAPPQIQADIPSARLAGHGTFRWFGLAIYDAQLWVGERGYNPDSPSAAPLALDLKYDRALVGKKIAESSRDEMQKLGLGSAEQRASWLAKMLAIFPDVQDGTHITGVYLPQFGAKFYLDGKALGEIADPEFGKAFFAIWLDPRTTGGKLREALLSDAAVR